MDGILCIDKPEGFTSFDVVAKIRGMLGTRKVGHAGTLDPMATGVLPLFVGTATKACDILPVQDKRYTATLRLGVSTDTQDITGTVLNRRPVKAGAAQVMEKVALFTGAQKQLPPMYSAVRVNGQRLYDLARKGVEVARKPRAITVYAISLLGADENDHTYTIDVACSKGAYIRTLCHDLGEALGCGAVLTALRRTAACGFSLDDCITLSAAQDLADQGILRNRLLPVSSVFTSYSPLRLDAKQTKMFGDGVRLSLARLGLHNAEPGASFTVFGSDGAFIAIATADPASDNLISKKWFGGARP
ncbi:MAG: tRNA pseudouridine(55) synthase TruB [Oscillospiraceae bacterium]|jgi:tRNA pseudouridine55 synthase|nr:tRNA pseudouridine(55) synthase TruB [Oscillospiraceae bacterium]